MEGVLGKRSWTRACQSARNQRMDFAREYHYINVQNIALETVEKERRRKRFDVIVSMKLQKGQSVKLTDGSEIAIRCVKADGIVVLENWDEIDPLSFKG